MKLIIQLPCFNEAESLPVSLAALPREVEGFTTVEWLVIDDGSSDNTAAVAREYGVDHIIVHSHNRGLASAFMTGLHECLRLEADVIVNTDADNQYQAKDIPKLARPVIAGEADYVIGERPISQTSHFSKYKKFFQKLGSWVVRIASGTKIPDAPSGFRALSRDCASQLNVYTSYTYTLETIIQAGRKGLRVTSVPIRTNAELRPSRLFSNPVEYVVSSMVTIIRISVVYQPFKFFASLSALMLFAGLCIGVRFLIFYFTGDGDGHIQSVILAGVFLIFGLQTLLVAFLADLLAVNRTLLEDLKLPGRRGLAGSGSGIGS